MIAKKTMLMKIEDIAPSVYMSPGFGLKMSLGDWSRFFMLTDEAEFVAALSRIDKKYGRSFDVRSGVLHMDFSSMIVFSVNCARLAYMRFRTHFSEYPGAAARDFSYVTEPPLRDMLLRNVASLCGGAASELYFLREFYDGVPVFSLCRIFGIDGRVVVKALDKKRVSYETYPLFGERVYSPESLTDCAIGIPAFSSALFNMFFCVSVVERYVSEYVKRSSTSLGRSFPPADASSMPFSYANAEVEPLSPQAKAALSQDLLLVNSLAGLVEKIGAIPPGSETYRRLAFLCRNVLGEPFFGFLFPDAASGDGDSTKLFSDDFVSVRTLVARLNAVGGGGRIDLLRFMFFLVYAGYLKWMGGGNFSLTDYAEQKGNIYFLGGDLMLDAAFFSSLYEELYPEFEVFFKMPS